MLVKHRRRTVLALNLHPCEIYVDTFFIKLSYELSDRLVLSTVCSQQFGYLSARALFADPPFILIEILYGDLSYANWLNNIVL